MKKKFIAILLILGGLAGFTTWWFGFREVSADYKSASQRPIEITEINYFPTDAEDEWLELYISGEPDADLSGWSLKLRSGKSYPLPTINKGKNSFVLISFGTKTGLAKLNTSFPEHKLVKICLNSTGEALKNTGDEILLLDQSEEIIDVVAYGEFHNGNYVRNYNKNTSRDLGGVADLVSTRYYQTQSDVAVFFINGTDMVANSNQSLALWGTNTNSSQDWISTVPTPGGPNIYEYAIEEPDVTIALYNGYFNPEMVPDNPEVRFHGGPSIAVTGSTLSGEQRDDIKEFVEHTLKFLKKHGFGDPKLGPDGKVDIHVVWGNHTETTGGTSSDGSVNIKIGTDARYGEVKQVCEHELVHVVQLNSVNGTSHECEFKDWWWDEGMAEYWGARSTMDNYNVSMDRLHEVLDMCGSINWFDHGRTLNGSYFHNWTWAGSQYTMNMFLIKFIEEVYGANKTVDIHNAIKRNSTDNSVIVGPRQAIEQVLGKSWDQILREFKQWRLLNATKANNAPPITEDVPMTYDGTTTPEDRTNVAPTGSVVEGINCTNAGAEPFNIYLQVSGKTVITVVRYNRDGTIETTHFTVYPGGSYSPIRVDPSKTARVRIIKTNLSTDTPVQVNMTTSKVTNTESSPAEGTKANPIQESGTPIVFSNSEHEGTDPYINSTFLPGLDYPEPEFPEEEGWVWYNISMAEMGSLNIKLSENHEWNPWAINPSETLCAITDFSFAVWNIDTLTWEEGFLINDDPNEQEFNLSSGEYNLILMPNDYMGFVQVSMAFI